MQRQRAVCDKWRLPGHGNAAHSSITDEFMRSWFNRSKSLHQQFYTDEGRAVLRKQQPGLYYTMLRRDQLLRDQGYSDAYIKSLSEFYNCNPSQSFGHTCRYSRPKQAGRFHSKVVYAFVHLSEARGHKHYVGSVHGPGVAGDRCGFVRAREHFQAAHSFVRSAAWHNATARSNTPSKLYEYMQSAGVHDLVIIPLQVLPANAPTRGSGAAGGGPGIEYVEQQWISRFWSLYWGYNTRMAHADPPVPLDSAFNPHCIGRLFGSRVWARRIAAVYCMYERRPALFLDGAYLQFFSGYSTATLVSLHTAVTMSPADIAHTIQGTQVPSAWVNDSFSPWIRHLLDVRYARLVVRYSSKFTPYSLHAAYSPVLEGMNVAAAMCQAAALHKLPASLHDTLPRRFTFKLPQPLGLCVCNHGKVAHNSAHDNATCPCVCDRPEFRGFQHPAFQGHVLTTDASILNDCPPEMRVAWQHGFKFRQPS
jgi:hypothetical protein